MINPPEQERTNDRLRLEVKKVLPQVIKLRHRLHQIPETSFQEKKTGELIRRELLSMNLDPEPVAQTGITATLSGKHSGNTLALRADMDALAITESTGKTYTS